MARGPAAPARVRGAAHLSAGDLTVRELAPGDAASLSACFRRCYGDSYPAEIFYDPHRLEGAIASRALRSVIAVTGDGTIAGHTGLTVRHPGAAAVEAGNTIVDPAHRGSGLLGRLGGALAELCRREGHIGYVHYPTTAHAIMQKRSVSGSGRETGVMLAYIPAETEYRDIDRRAGRLAATVVYQPFAPAPVRTVHLPARHRTLVESLYRALDLDRRSLDPRVPPPLAAASAIDAHFEPRRSRLHHFVRSPGSDLLERVGSDLHAHRPAIAHVDLPLDDAAIDATVNALRTLDFCYCALLPEFAHTDVLRLQRIDPGAAASAEPELANRDARDLLAYIRTDAARA